jgi:aminopeptidase N
MKKILSTLALFSLWYIAKAQKPDAVIDIVHYRFEVSLTDQSDLIKGKAIIQYRKLLPEKKIQLDLITPDASGKGMKVLAVTAEGLVKFEHRANVLTLNFNNKNETGTVQTVQITYEGIPSDGLIIGKNKYGHRGFFADHWPQRAHYWLPCVDHPADKATVDFVVTAPDHYRVVANGVLKEEKELGQGFKQTTYTEEMPLPTKVMAIGVADFSVQQSGTYSGVPVYSWVYPEEEERGARDYAQALDVLPFYASHIGPYAYRKLANVQSRTRFGGLENANTIFYSENSITGQLKNTALIAHEIAHQWFGNMATEKDWPHVWLSEGFATYLTNCFMESRFGSDTLKSLLKQQRKEVIAFADKDKYPVVDSIHTDPMQLLNANSYQKGGWVLHLLRRELGDELFWKSIKTYYEKYSGKNADTRDFQHTVETVSQRALSDFFDQWLYQPGVPQLDIRWDYHADKKEATLRVVQLQPHLFNFPLEFCFTANNVPLGDSPERQFIKERISMITVPLPVRPKNLIVDPEINMLVDYTISPPELH